MQLHLAHRNGQAASPRFNRLEPEVRAMNNIVRSYNNWRRYRETCGELNRLSQRELSDLGISRADIPSIARQAVR